MGAKTSWKWLIILKHPLRKKKTWLIILIILLVHFILCVKKISFNIISYRYLRLSLQYLYLVVGGMNSDLAQSWWRFCNNYVKATHTGDMPCEILNYVIKVPCSYYYNNLVITILLKFKRNQSAPTCVLNIFDTNHFPATDRRLHRVKLYSYVGTRSLGYGCGSMREMLEGWSTRVNVRVDFSSLIFLIR